MNKFEKIPCHVKSEMELTDAEAEELIDSVNEAALQCEGVMKALGIGGDQELEIAFRPLSSRVFFKLVLAARLDREQEVCIAFIGFERMSKEEYIEYCEEEYGTYPEGLGPHHSN